MLLLLQCNRTRPGMACLLTSWPPPARASPACSRQRLCRRCPPPARARTHPFPTLPGARRRGRRRGGGRQRRGRGRRDGPQGAHRREAGRAAGRRRQRRRVHRRRGRGDAAGWRLGLHLLCTGVARQTRERRQGCCFTPAAAAAAVVAVGARQRCRCCCGGGERLVGLWLGGAAPRWARRRRGVPIHQLALCAGPRLPCSAVATSGRECPAAVCGARAACGCRSTYPPSLPCPACQALGHLQATNSGRYQALMAGMDASARAGVEAMVLHAAAEAQQAAAAGGQ
jgi:hypothetical protein